MADWIQIFSFSTKDEKLWPERERRSFPTTIRFFSLMKVEIDKFEGWLFPGLFRFSSSFLAFWLWQFISLPSYILDDWGVGVGICRSWCDHDITLYCVQIPNCFLPQEQATRIKCAMYNSEKNRFPRTKIAFQIWFLQIFSFTWIDLEDFFRFF